MFKKYKIQKKLLRCALREERRQMEQDFMPKSSIPNIPVSARYVSPRRVLRIAVIAAVLLCMLVGGAYAVRLLVYRQHIEIHDHKIEITGNLTPDEILEVKTPEEAYRYVSSRLGIPILIPNSLDDEFVLKESLLSGEPGSDRVNCRFTYAEGGNLLTFEQEYIRSATDGLIIDTTDGKAEQMRIGGRDVTFCTVSRDGQPDSYIVTWFEEQDVGGLLCTVSSTCPPEQIKRFVKNLKYTEDETE